jgi:hypothetical protein
MEAIKKGEKYRPRTKFASRYPFAEPYNGNQRAIVTPPMVVRSLDVHQLAQVSEIGAFGRVIALQSFAIAP